MVQIEEMAQAVVMAAIERTLRSCIAQAAAEIPISEWTTDYAQILKASRLEVETRNSGLAPCRTCGEAVTDTGVFMSAYETLPWRHALCKDVADVL